MNSYKDYHFFINGPFSNWHQCLFEVDGIEFTSGEQFMMYEKARIFNDMDIAEQILQTRNCNTIKSLGRKVKGYNEAYWDKVRKETVKRGLREKFAQNSDLKRYLLGFADKILVEAASYDRIWGIGYGMDDSRIMRDRDKWGLNLLGQILNELAEEFLKKEVKL